MGIEINVEQDKIRKWVEQRDGKPAHQAGAEWLLRVRFSDPEIKDLDRFHIETDWERFFAEMDRQDLAFECSDEPGSRYYRLVDRSGYPDIVRTSTSQ